MFARVQDGGGEAVVVHPALVEDLKERLGEKNVVVK